MAEALEVSTELPAPLATVCRVAGVSRSAACEQRRRRSVSAPAPGKPGPVGAMTDRELLAEIRRVLADSPFIGEGHRKLWARLRRCGVRTSRKRVLRLTREAGLLAPTARVRKRAARLHEGTITVAVPDTLWATDATEAWSREGRAAIFCVVDHASGEAWTDAALRMDRFAAADLLREVCSERFGSVEHAVASGLALRYDGGPCFRSQHYQAEIDHLGIARSPAFHYEPETTAASSASSRHSRSSSSGSNASRPSSSSASPCALSPAATTASGCSSVTATGPRPRHANICSRSPCDDHVAVNQGVRRTGGGATFGCCSPI